jgi:mono/diheme cytochrome c family protein
MKLLTASIITTVTTMVLLLAGIQTVKAQSSNWTIPSYTDTLQNPYPIDKDLIADGHKIFKSNCQTCHGSKAKGNGPAAVALNPKPANLTAKAVQGQKLGSLYYRVSNGHLDMPAWKSSLSQKQIWSVVVYIKSLTNKDLLADK